MLVNFDIIPLSARSDTILSVSVSTLVFFVRTRWRHSNASWDRIYF